MGKGVDPFALAFTNLSSLSFTSFTGSAPSWRPPARFARVLLFL
jgi:hypothetical protein